MATASITVVELRGSPRERGRAHGEALRDQIAAVREQWRESLTARFGIAPAAFIATFLGETRFADAMRRWTPALLEETLGIAEGSGRAREETLAFQFMDEEWWFGAARFRRAPAATNRCSVVASRGRDGAAPILAQNMDLHGFLDGGQAVIQVRGSNGEPDATILTICGMIALCGANDAGVGVAVNTLWQLPSAADGLPVACVARSILSKRTLGDARGWIQSVRHASGQHYLIGDPDGFASFEASGARVTEVPWSASSPTYAHTNHPLTGGKTAPANPAEENSRGRYAALCGIAAGKALSVEEVKSALADRTGSHPISVRRDPDNPGATMTFASIVMELARPPAIQIAGGPPCSYPYRTVGAQR
jgi:isopenicillin-N N-acyltransferase-like protein